MREKDLKISNILIQWYSNHKRELPWRDTNDAYTIWVSEVILQQTRVGQGHDYFNRFIQRFPNIRSLASADESEVLKLWQGLGYYSRARNMHAAAKVVESEFGGVFPKNYKEVLSLRGVGGYTAAAIVSFAYNLPYAVVDGNVYRVLSRLFAIATPINTGKGKKEFAELAQVLLDAENAGLHNQSIMEFGALQCVPVSPDCEVCPLSSLCLSYSKGNVKMFPVKDKKASVRDRYFYYFDIHVKGAVFLRKRIYKDIWQNLFELPLIEKEQNCDFLELQKQQEFLHLFEKAENMSITHMLNVKHVLSHQRIHASFYKVEVDEIYLDDSYLKVKKENIDNYPVSRLVHKYFEQSY